MREQGRVGLAGLVEVFQLKTADCILHSPWRLANGWTAEEFGNSR